MNNRDQDNMLGYVSLYEIEKQHFLTILNVGIIMVNSTVLYRQGLNKDNFSFAVVLLGNLLSLIKKYNTTNFNAKPYRELLATNNPIVLFSNKEELRNSFTSTMLNTVFMIVCSVKICLDEVNRSNGTPVNLTTEAACAIAVIFTFVQQMHNFLNNFGAKIVQPQALRLPR